MKELEQMQKAMDEFFAYLDSPSEKKKRDDEALKEAAHRKDEGLDEGEEESRTDYAQGMYDSGMCEKDFL